MNKMEAKLLISGLPLDVRWDGRRATVSDLSAPYMALRTAALCLDTLAATTAIDLIAQRTGKDPTGLATAYTTLLNLAPTDMCASPLPPPNCFRRPKPPVPTPLEWWGSQAQALFLSAIHKCMGLGPQVPPCLLVALAPAPVTPLPKEASAREILSLAGDWCRAHYLLFDDISTRVGLRVGGRLLRLRSLGTAQDKNSPSA